MIIFRRLPGILFNHVYAVSLVLIFSLILIFLLLSWGFLCSNLEPWNHVNKICRNYNEGKIVGCMCHSLCTYPKMIHSYSCRAFHAGKEAVFAATWSNSTSDSLVVIKSANIVENSAGLSWANSLYPSEQEFTSMIQQTVNSRLNLTLSQEDVISLSKFPSANPLPEGTNARRKEMADLWNLLQDNEYLMSRIYESYNIFPRIIGVCGQYYISEYVEPVLDTKLSQFLGQDGSWIVWEMRLHFSSLLLNLVDTLDSLGLLVCDVKPGHFGLSSTGDNLKLLDLDVTFPKVTADKITSDGRSCTKDEDCAIFDCVSKCDEITRTCRSPVISTNLQVICEKVFLGGGSRGGGSGGFVSFGGLLLGDRTPPDLASMLRQCSQGNLERTSLLQSAIDSILRSLTSSNKVQSEQDYH